MGSFHAGLGELGCATVAVTANGIQGMRQPAAVSLLARCVEPQPVMERSPEGLSVVYVTQYVPHPVAESQKSTPLQPSVMEQ
jgi:hypothetical protein